MKYIRTMVVVLSLFILYAAYAQESVPVTRRVVIAFERSAETRWQTGSIRSLVSDVIDELPHGCEVAIYEFAKDVSLVAHTQALTLSQAKGIRERLPISGTKTPYVNYDLLLQELKRWTDRPSALLLLTRGVSNPSPAHSFVELIPALSLQFPSEQGHKIYLVSLADDLVSQYEAFLGKDSIWLHRLGTNGFKPAIYLDAFLYQAQTPPIVLPTATQTIERTPTPTETLPPTPTSTTTATASSTSSPTCSWTPSWTSSLTPTSSQTHTKSPTSEPSSTPTPTLTPSSTRSATSPPSHTPSPVPTSTVTVTKTPTRTPEILLVGSSSSFKPPEGQRPTPHWVLLLLCGVGFLVAGYGIYRWSQPTGSSISSTDQIRVFDLAIMDTNGDEILAIHDIPVDGQPEVLTVGPYSTDSLYLPEVSQRIRLRLLPDGNVQVAKGWRWINHFLGEPIPLDSELSVVWSSELRDTN